MTSQSKIVGNYQVSNFSSTENGIGTENWGSEILDNGHIIFANNTGILDFNGVNFTTYSLPNKSIVRSLCVTDRGIIYVGGQDEIGYFGPNANGTLEFNSIRAEIPSEFLPLEDIWQMLIFNDKLFFRSVNRIYTYDLKTTKFKILDPHQPVSSLIQLNNKVYFQQSELGLASVDDTTDISYQFEYFKDEILVNIHEIEKYSIVVTEGMGIFKISNGQILDLNPQLSSFLKKNRVFTSIKLKDEKIAIGTQFDGIVIIDHFGNTLTHINKISGLINNNIRSLSLDLNENLWAGTYNGISKLHLNSQLKEIQPDTEESSIYYDAFLYNNNLYFASNNGMFYTKLPNKSDSLMPYKFSFVKQSQGQVWGIDTIEGDFLMAHDKGPYKIIDDISVPISNRRGAWKFLATGKKNTMYVGTYNGVDIYKKESNQWIFDKKLEGFNESSRILISVKENELWVSHPYRGIYKIKHDDNFENVNIKLYGEKSGLPSKLQNYIFNIGGIPYVTGETGIFNYDRNNDDFVSAEIFNKLLDPSINTKRLIEDGNDRIWFISEHEVGYLKKETNGDYSKRSFPELVGKFVGGFEQLSFVDSNFSFICTNENIILQNHSREITKSKPKLSINKVELSSHQDSILFGGYSFMNDHISSQQENGQIPNLHHNENALNFQFSSSEHSEYVNYSLRLNKDQEEEWSDWSSTTSKEFNNLVHGNYLFEVKARSKHSVESDIQSFAFIINPPWYLSIWAKIFYLLFVLSTLAGIVLIPNKKYKKEKEKLAYGKRKSEEDLALIKYEKLQADIDYKNAELASATMHLVQKNETISKIKHELDNVQIKSKNNETRKELRKVLSLLNDDERLENEWENFAFHFDQVHTNFLKRLSEKHSNLTSKDLKLCAYLKMNLSTKEIAPLLNISVRGTEISRYRLRKKLELLKDQNLNEYMMKF